MISTLIDQSRFLPYLCLPKMFPMPTFSYWASAQSLPFGRTVNFEYPHIWDEEAWRNILTKVLQVRTLGSDRNETMSNSPSSIE